MDRVMVTWGHFNQQRKWLHGKAADAIQAAKPQAATVMHEGPNMLVLIFDHEPNEEYEFEYTGRTGLWYEINNPADAVKIVDVKK